MSALKFVLIAVVGIMATACTHQDYITDASDRYFHQKEVSNEETTKAVAEADWAKAEKITIQMTPQGFSPMFVQLKRGEPYNLVFENTNEGDNVIASEDFFRNIAVKSVTDYPGSLADKLVDQLHFDEGQARSLEIVPLKAGRFSVSDNRWGIDMQPWHINPFAYLHGRPKMVLTVE